MGDMPVAGPGPGSRADRFTLETPRPGRSVPPARPVRGDRRTTGSVDRPYRDPSGNRPGAHRVQSVGPPLNRDEGSMTTSSATDPEDAAASARIHLSASALEKVREMLEEEDLAEEGGLRISARHGAGCSAPLQFSMILEVEPGPDDVILTGEGIRIFLDPRSAWSLDGLVVDYVDTPMLGSGFAFRHPRGAPGRVC